MNGGKAIETIFEKSENYKQYRCVEKCYPIDLPEHRLSAPMAYSTTSDVDICIGICLKNAKAEGCNKCEKKRTDQTTIVDNAIPTKLPTEDVVIATMKKESAINEVPLVKYLSQADFDNREISTNQPESKLIMPNYTTAVNFKRFNSNLPSDVNTFSNLDVPFHIYNIQPQPFKSIEPAPVVTPDFFFMTSPISYAGSDVPYFDLDVIVNLPNRPLMADLYDPLNPLSVQPMFQTNQFSNEDLRPISDVFTNSMPLHSDWRPVVQVPDAYAANGLDLSIQDNSKANRPFLDANIAVNLPDLPIYFSSSIEPLSNVINLLAENALQYLANTELVQGPVSYASNTDNFINFPFSTANEFVDHIGSPFLNTPGQISNLIPNNNNFAPLTEYFENVMPNSADVLKTDNVYFPQYEPIFPNFINSDILQSLPLIRPIDNLFGDINITNDIPSQLLFDANIPTFSALAQQSYPNQAEALGTFTSQYDRPFMCNYQIPDGPSLDALLQSYPCPYIDTMEYLNKLLSTSYPNRYIFEEISSETNNQQMKPIKPYLHLWKFLHQQLREFDNKHRNLFEICMKQSQKLRSAIEDLVNAISYQMNTL